MWDLYDLLLWYFYCSFIVAGASEFRSNRYLADLLILSHRFFFTYFVLLQQNDQPVPA